MKILLSVILATNAFSCVSGKRSSGGQLSSVGAPSLLQTSLMKEHPNAKAIRCLEKTAQRDVAGICLFLEDNFTPNYTAYAAYIKPFNNSQSGLIEVSGEEAEPTGGSAIGSLETYIVDGGGEDTLLGTIGEQLNGFGEYESLEKVRCLQVDNKAIGVCLVDLSFANVKKVTAAVVVSEKNGGPAQVMHAELLKK